MELSPTTQTRLDVLIKSFIEKAVKISEESKEIDWKYIESVTSLTEKHFSEDEEPLAKLLMWRVARLKTKQTLKEAFVHAALAHLISEKLEDAC